jgi:hypothetical protein
MPIWDRTNPDFFEASPEAYAERAHMRYRVGTGRARWLVGSSIVLVIACVVGGMTTACSQSVTSSKGSAASDRMAALAGIPTEAPSPAAAANPVPLVDAATLAAARTEAVTVISLARAFMAEHPSSRAVTSSDLSSLYSGGPPKAKYYLDAAGMGIVRVDRVPDGWKGIVFGLSAQTWREGTPDGDHAEDQDTP